MKVKVKKFYGNNTKSYSPGKNADAFLNSNCFTNEQLSVMWTEGIFELPDCPV